MPEHDLPDLDRAFESLTRDLATRPGAPGAPAAVATARRRRRTTLAGAGAVVLLAAGALALPHLTGGTAPHDRSDLASTDDTVVFTGAAFTDATAGWTGPWREMAKGDESMADVAFGQPSCLDDLPNSGENTEPSRFGDVVLLSETERSATFVTFAEFATTAEAATVLDIFDSTALQNACGVVPHVSEVDDMRAMHLHVPAAAKQPAADVWLAVDGSRIAMLGVASPEAAPPEVRERVAELLADAMDSDVSFESSMMRIEGGSDSAGASGGEMPAFRTLTRAAVARETGGWPDRITTSTELPCTSNFPLVDQSWGSMSVDDMGFSAAHAGLESEAAARSSVDSVAETLTACRATTWVVTTGTLRGDRTLSASSAEGTLVLAQRGKNLAWVTIGETGAPETARTTIAALLHDTLASPVAPKSSSPRRGQESGRRR